MEQTLAMECGATSTRVGLYDHEKKLLIETTGGPSNPAEIGVEACIALLTFLGKRLVEKSARIDGVVAGVSGASVCAIRDRIAGGIGRSLPVKHARVYDDRWPLLIANAGVGDGVVVISGTGSSVLAQSRTGGRVDLGGRGGLIGDEGSAYKLALRGLRACAHALDGVGPPTDLLEAMLDVSGFTCLRYLTEWLLHANKQDVAGLATVVTECAEREDAVAVACIREEAALLVRQTCSAYDRLNLTDEAPLFLNGGLIEGSPAYRKAYQEALEKVRPGVVPRIAVLRGHQAVLESAFVDAPAEIASTFTATGGATETDVPPTEAQYPGGTPIDRLSPREMVRMMNREDARVHGAVARQEEAIARAIEKVAGAFGRGGRLIYIGAGTSGRLGVLDAAECPPTFGVPPGKVIGIIAGKDKALRTSVEGAEDDPGQGAADLSAVVPPPGPNDVVVGITASGTTPYVIGALEEAERRGAETVLVTCNPACGVETSILIAMATGPEVLAGSTRLKAGTATKMVLNMISTGAMALSGHIRDGLMVGMRPVNKKLRKRAVNIIQMLAGVDAQKAEVLLDEAGGRIAEALKNAASGMTDG